MTALDHLFLIFSLPTPGRHYTRLDLEIQSGLADQEVAAVTALLAPGNWLFEESTLLACRAVAFGMQTGMELEDAIMSLPPGSMTHASFKQSISQAAIRNARELRCRRPIEDSAFVDAIEAIAAAAWSGYRLDQAA